MTGLGFSIDDKLYEEFSKLVDDSGYIKYRAVEGALRVFMAFLSYCYYYALSLLPLLLIGIPLWEAWDK